MSRQKTTDEVKKQQISSCMAMKAHNQAFRKVCCAMRAQSGSSSEGESLAPKFKRVGSGGCEYRKPPFLFELDPSERLANLESFLD